jgi:hypothetical protein
MVAQAREILGGVMAAKKVQARSKKAAAKKGARKVSPATPRGMAKRYLFEPPAIQN